MTESLFRTNRLQIVAFLLARGQQLDHAERLGHKVYFYFKNHEACLALQAEFFTASPPEKVFWSKLNDAKDILTAQGVQLGRAHH